MNLKELINAISIEHEIPANTARKVTVSVLTKIAQCVENEETLRTPYFLMGIVNRPEKEAKDEATGQTVTIPARKFGRVIPRKPESN